MKILLLVVVILLAGCSSKAPETMPEPAAAPSMSAVLGEPGRLAKDLERDERSRPDVIVPMLDLEPGDRVADIFGGSGYYSEILAGVVGPDGEVLLHNNAAYNRFANIALTERFAGRSFANIIRLNSEVSDLQLGTETLDAALIIMSYHDLYLVDEENGWPAIDADDFLSQIHDALKPGGRFLIVDHAAQPGTGSSAAQTLHRIDPAFAKVDIEGQGFRLWQVSNALANADDDHTLSVFDPAIRFRTDRFVHVYVKPD